MKKTNQKPNLPFQTVEVMDQINVESKSGEESKTLDHEIVDCSKDEDQKNKIQESEVQILEVKENTLSIKSVKQKEDNKVEVLHRGISKKYFERHFTIADDVKVNCAELNNGLLIVSLERIVPEQKKPRTIKIN